MSVLYFFESIRCPVLDFFFGAITYLGSEIGLIVLALLFFWCIDKREGYYLFLVGFIGTLFNQFLKILCRVPRPWVLDPTFRPVESAIEGATGYSFPSGHTQASVGLFGGIAYGTKRRRVRALCLVLCVLVPLSRMYLGVHTPLDVLASVGLALLLILLLRPLVRVEDARRMACLLGGATALSVGYLLFVLLFPFPADTDPVNLAEAVKNAYTLLGVLLGLDLAYFADARYKILDTAAPTAGQILKYLLGLAIALGIKEGLKAPLSALLGRDVQNAVRYFLLVVFAGILWPLTFRFFKKIGKKKTAQ